ncbi:MAG: lamin tail domain-containing protein [Anaerolineae bacterium]
MRRFLKIALPLFLFLLLMSGLSITSAFSTTLVINEIDYDQPGTDGAEFLEIKNVSGGAINLSGYQLVFINGGVNPPASYRSVALPAVSLAAGDYYVVCANPATVTNCDLDASPDTDWIQNGAPDAVQLLLSGSPVDIVSYEGITSGFTEGAGGAPTDTAAGSEGISRCPDGTDSDQNSADFLLRAITPGVMNNCPMVVNDDPNALKINEIDYDQPGNDTAEFIEIKNVSASAANLDNFSIALVNGVGPAVYGTIDLPNVSLAAGDYYVICVDAANVPNCDLDAPATQDMIQNGAPDAVAIVLNSAVVETVSYEGSTGAPYSEGAGSAAEDSNDTGGIGIGRCPDGADTNDNNADFLLRNITPGAANDCPPEFPVVEIWQIQGSAHLSPYLGQTIITQDNIVTALRTNGFYIQTPDARGDADAATSNGVFVFTLSAPTVVVGDQVDVRGTVAEFRPGGLSGGGLTVTELTSPLVTRDSSGNALPSNTIIGSGGRVPPTAVINDDGTGNIETSGTFDIATDGIDFYESLEGMLVQVNNGLVVGPTSDFNETWVVADNGAGATGMTPRGGVLISPGDFNPERIQLDDLVYPGAPASWPLLSAGDTLTSPAVGVMDYSFGNFEILVTQSYTAASGGLPREVTSLDGTGNQLTVATFNVENLPGNAASSEYDTRAAQIVNHLGSPDILVLEEIQDNNGTLNDSVTDATVTLNNLINAIVAAGGPAYQFQQIDPVDDADGGAPGGNIRVGFLYNPARVTFVARPGAGSTTANSAVCGVNGAELAFSPGRIDPTNSAFSTSRKPLAGEFLFNGETVFIIGLHFNSKGGDNPLFGFTQPPVLSSEVQRLQQAQIVNDFVDGLLACQADANIIVLGDVNDFDFSTVASTLSGGVLNGLMSTLPANERYSYVFEGNSQVLDQILVSNHVLDNLLGYDVVHVNAEFTDQVSDHDPSVMLARFNSAPQVVDDEYTTDEALALNVPVAEGVLVNDSDVNPDTLTAVLVSTTANGTLNLSSDGSFSYTPMGSFNGVDTFTYQADDGTTLSSVATVTIHVNDVNQMPVVVNPGPQSNAAASAVSLQIVANDPDNDVLLYSATGLPEGLSIDGLTGLISGTLDNNAAANSPYSVTVTVEDNGVPTLSDSAAFIWTVTTPAEPAVLTFTLVNADTDTDIGPLHDGDIIDLSLLPTANLSVRADTLPASVGSVRFGLDTSSNYRTDNNAPYTLGNGNDNNYQPVELSIGTHTLTATPYTRRNANGDAGTPLTITFEVRPQLVSGFVLVNADTDTDIMPINDGATLDLAALPPNLNIRAITAPADVGSVRFGVDGTNNFRTDNSAPYAVGGESNGNFHRLDFTLGNHTLVATAYTRSGAQGLASPSLTIHVNVVNNPNYSPAEGATVSNPATLSWNAIIGTTCYAVQVDNNRGFNSPEVNVIVVNDHMLTLSALPARTYYWRVGISVDCSTPPTTWGDRHQFVIAP